MIEVKIKESERGELCNNILRALPKWFGIGHRLVQDAESYLKEKGFKFFTVKTLSPSKESEEYRRTRLFYQSEGFIELEEVKTLWDKHNPCLMMIKSVS